MSGIGINSNGPGTNIGINVIASGTGTGTGASTKVDNHPITAEGKSNSHIMSPKSDRREEIFRIPSAIGSKESETRAIVRYPSISKGIVDQDPVDFSISSLCLEKDDVWSVPSSPFIFDQKFSDVSSSSNQDHDIELGTKPIRGSRGRYLL